MSEYGSGASKLNEQEVKNQLCERAGAEDFGWTESECLDSFARGRGSSAARAAWKFGAYNSVSGTPTAFLNGVQVENFPTTSSAWQSLLRNSLKGAQELSA